MVAEVVRVALYDFGGYRCVAVEKILQIEGDRPPPSALDDATGLRFLGVYEMYARQKDGLQR